MLLDEEMDHGAVLAHITYHISPSTIGSELSQALAKEGAKLLVETLPKWLAGEIEPQPQDHNKATFTKMLERADGRIDWNKSAEGIEKMVHAYDAWPGTFTLWSGKRLKILRARLLHATIGCTNDPRPGYVWTTSGGSDQATFRRGLATRSRDDGSLAVNCNPGSIILDELQLEGKKSMKGEEFLRGYPKCLDSILT